MQLTKSGVLERYGVRLLGTGIDAINKAEDRELFRDTMRAIGQPCVPSEIAEDVETALAAAERIGYPVIVRPAFTLGGSGGGIARGAEELRVIARAGLDASPITQILVEKSIAVCLSALTRVSTWRNSSPMLLPSSRNIISGSVPSATPGTAICIFTSCGTN